MHKLLFPAALAALAVTASGQTRVAPDGLANDDANSFHWVPVRFSPSRSQQAYDASVLAKMPTMMIRSIGVRANGSVTYTTPAHTFITTIQMGSAGVKNADQLSGTSYMANRTGVTDWKTVLNAVRISYPAVRGGNGAPRPFVKTPLTTPFAYTRGNNLLVQYDDSTTSGNPEVYRWYVDQQRFDGTGWFRRSGTSCPTNGVTRGNPPKPGGTMAWWFDSRSAPSVPAVGIIGTSTSRWGPFTLPFDLTAFGGPGCTLYTDPAASIPGVTDPNSTVGRYRVNLTVPSSAAFDKAVLYTQTLVLDRTYNSLGARVSQLGRHDFGTLNAPSSAPVRFLYSYDTSTARNRINDKPLFDTPNAVVHSFN